MTKREFVLGRGGVTIAVIRRDGDSFSLIPVDGDRSSLLNGQSMPKEGGRLIFGDSIEVAGVKLRFASRVPLTSPVDHGSPVGREVD
jgi:hypothetical protein